METGSQGGGAAATMSRGSHFLCVVFSVSLESYYACVHMHTNIYRNFHVLTFNLFIINS